MSSHPNHVVELPDPPVDSFAVTFTIETADGTIEGYYVGTLHGSAGDSAATVNAHGQILAVSGVYADLFLADVFVTGEVPLDPEGVGTEENPRSSSHRDGHDGPLLDASEAYPADQSPEVPLQGDSSSPSSRPSLDVSPRSASADLVPAPTEAVRCTSWPPACERCTRSSLSTGAPHGQ